MFFFLLSLQAATAAAPPPGQEPPRYAECMDLATGDPSQGAAARRSGRSRAAGCSRGNASASLMPTRSAGRRRRRRSRKPRARRESAHDVRSANYWAQAGNAWLAAGEPVKARAALDAALASGTLTGLALGEARLDRARVLVAAGDMEGARGDLDRALADAKADPLAWLLSATLARRQGDLPRARRPTSPRRCGVAADDPQVQLEAGNIAALAATRRVRARPGDRVLELAPGSPLGRIGAQGAGAVRGRHRSNFGDPPCKGWGWGFRLGSERRLRGAL
jgi:tetratricopeptide (TPR) repeat protein